MISVIRSSKPGVLKKKEADWLRALQNATTPKARQLAQNKYRHPDVQASLEAMFHGKCAYCESKINHISHAHIEHYRPKLRFPLLTFTWENLLWACSVCNSDNKGDYFPETADGGPILNPCDDAPEHHLRFVYDPIACVASVYGATERGETTEKLLQLNRADLRTYRSQYIRKLASIAILAETNSEARQIFEAAMQNDAEYAAFARTF